MSTQGHADEVETGMVAELLHLLAMARDGKLDALAIIDVEDGVYRHFAATKNQDHSLLLLGGVCLLQRRIEATLKADEVEQPSGPGVKLVAEADDREDPDDYY